MVTLCSPLPPSLYHDAFSYHALSSYVSLGLYLLNAEAGIDATVPLPKVI